MTNNQVAIAYQLINKADMSKMEGADKYLLSKVMYKLTPVVEELQALAESAKQSMKADDFDEMDEKLRLYQKDPSSMSPEQANEVKAYMDNYYNEVNKCFEEELQKEIFVDYPKLSEKAFTNLLSSNNWTWQDIGTLEKVLC